MQVVVVVVVFGGMVVAVVSSGDQTTPRRGGVCSLCAKRGIPGGQSVCRVRRTPLSQDRVRVQYTQGQVKGRVWTCGFEPAKALVRGLKPLPRPPPFQGCLLGELPSTTYEGSRPKRVSWQRPDARMV